MRKGELESRLLVLVTLGLVAFGLVMVYSATSAAAALGGADPSAYLKRHAADARRRGESRGRPGPGRDLDRAVPPRARLQLPPSVARRPGHGLPDRPGHDRTRLRWSLRRRSRPGHPEGELPARGPHGHDLRCHRRGARPRRLDDADPRL